MRNPWGKKEWTGDWSDSSQLWTPELKAQLNVSSREDGIFFMSMNDFQKYFNDIAICYYHNGFVYNSLKLKSIYS
jgi:calpain-15